MFDQRIDVGCHWLFVFRLQTPVFGNPYNMSALVCAKLSTAEEYCKDQTLIFGHLAFVIAKDSIDGQRITIMIGSCHNFRFVASNSVFKKYTLFALKVYFGAQNTDLSHHFHFCLSLSLLHQFQFHQKISFVASRCVIA